MQFPSYSYADPAYITLYYWDELNTGQGTVTNGAVSSYSDMYALSIQNIESGIGLHAGSGPGPFMVVNNLIECTGVCGTFLADDNTNNTSPCGWAIPCSLQYQMGNLTEQRNKIFANPCYFYDAACWNGGAYAWRNLTENKQGGKVLRDGNIYGPYFLQVAQGQCLDQLTYYQGFLATTGLVNWVDSSDATITNNTCQYLGGQMSTNPWFTSTTPALPQKNIYVHNNLFYNDNAYAQTAALTPLQAVITKTGIGGNCPFGKGVSFGGNGQNFVYDHNTTYGQGGCQTWFYTQFLTLQSGTSFTNNIFNLVSDPGPYSGLLQSGTYATLNYNFGGGADAPDCNATQGTALFNCQSSFNWAGNVVLATWTNSLPGSQVEFTNAQIATAKALLPSNTIWPTAGTTLANRISQVAWYTPSTMNMRLKYNSPYISGAKASADGLDIGVDMDALEAAQGKVSNVHTHHTTSTSTIVGFLAPDAFGCTVDWGTSNFPSGTGTFSRVTNAGGQRVQNVALTGLPAHANIYYRVNCAVQQPVSTVQLP
jgi:hypothetical protein